MHSARKPLYSDKRNVLNKAGLIEPIVRHLIQESLFYKQYLYLTNEETILPIIVEHVKYVGGTNANGRPSPFLCCLFRLLEIEPSTHIVDICINQMGTNQFKYMTALFMIYVRLAWKSEDVYRKLEPFYADRRKIRVLLKSPIVVNGLPTQYSLSYIDSWCDELLHDLRAADVILPKLAPRLLLERKAIMEPRKYYFSDEEMSSLQSDDSESFSD